MFLAPHRFNYAHKDTDVVKTTLHWHAHAVADLCFTTDGTYSVTLTPDMSFVNPHTSSLLHMCTRLLLPHSHAHTSPTPTLAPPTGTYLLSGGEEGVLVLWQLDTNKKQFRPRLGSPITRLACCPGDKFFTVGLESNGELFIIVACVHGMKSKDLC